MPAVGGLLYGLVLAPYVQEVTQMPYSLALACVLTASSAVFELNRFTCWLLVVELFQDYGLPTPLDGPTPPPDHARPPRSDPPAADETT